MNQIFDTQRIISLFKLSIALNKRAILLAFAGFFGFVFITSFFVANFNPSGLNQMHIFFYFTLLLGGTTLSAGRSFWHINTTERSIAHLSLPASTLEKYIVPWFQSGILWAIVSVICYLLFAVIINAFWALVMNFEFESFNPFVFLDTRNHQNQIYYVYFLFHSIFFLGATAFQRHPIPKTLLAGFIVNSVFTFVFLFVMIILFGGVSDFQFTVRNPETWQENFRYLFEEILPYLVKYAFVYVLPVIFYIVAFFKLKEREV